MSMFTTDEARELVPEVMRSTLWIALVNMKNPSFSQRFDLSALHENGKNYQHIVHTQKGSEYRKEYKIEFETPMGRSTVYIIGFGKHWLMMLTP